LHYQKAKEAEKKRKGQEYSFVFCVETDFAHFLYSSGRMEMGLLLYGYILGRDSKGTVV
jgi:hypothetical protein